MTVAQTIPFIGTSGAAAPAPKAMSAGALAGSGAPPSMFGRILSDVAVEGDTIAQPSETAASLGTPGGAIATLAGLGAQTGKVLIEADPLLSDLKSDPTMLPGMINALADGGAQTPAAPLSLAALGPPAGSETAIVVQSETIRSVALPTASAAASPSSENSVATLSNAAAPVSVPSIGQRLMSSEIASVATEDLIVTMPSVKPQGSNPIGIPSVGQRPATQTTPEMPLAVPTSPSTVTAGVAGARADAMPTTAVDGPQDTQAALMTRSGVGVAPTPSNGAASVALDTTPVRSAAIAVASEGAGPSLQGENVPQMMRGGQETALPSQNGSAISAREGGGGTLPASLGATPTTTVQAAPETSVPLDAPAATATSKSTLTQPSPSAQPHPQIGEAGRASAELLPAVAQTSLVKPAREAGAANAPQVVGTPKVAAAPKVVAAEDGGALSFALSTGDDGDALATERLIVTVKASPGTGAGQPSAVDAITTSSLPAKPLVSGGSTGSAPSEQTTLDAEILPVPTAKSSLAGDASLSLSGSKDETVSTASATSQQSPANQSSAPAGASASMTTPVRVGVSQAAMAFASAVADGGATADDGWAGLDGFDSFTGRGELPMQTGSAARALQSLPMSAPQQAAATAHLAAEVARFSSKGATKFQIRMDPAELGRVDVELKIASDGSVRAHLAVERSETLDMFMRDQRGLERALDAAGLKLESGSVQLSLRDQGGFSGFAGSDGSAGEGGDNGASQSGQASGDADDTDALPAVSQVHVSGSRGAVDIQI